MDSIVIMLENAEMTSPATQSETRSGQTEVWQVYWIKSCNISLAAIPESSAQVQRIWPACFQWKSIMDTFPNTFPIQVPNLSQVTSVV